MGEASSGVSSLLFDDLIDNAWDLDAVVVADLPFDAYYQAEVEVEVPEPPVVQVAGAGGYAPFLLPLKPRHYRFEMDVRFVLAAGHSAYHRHVPLPPLTPPLIVRPPSRHYRKIARGLEGIFSASLEARRQQRITQEVEVVLGAGAESRFTDFIRTRIIPDDEDILTLL